MFFPILLSILILFFISSFYNNYEEKNAQDKQNLWGEKARTVLASVQSNHELTQIIRHVGNEFAFALETNYLNKLIPANFSDTYQKKLFQPLPIKPDFAWAFKVNGDRAETITHPPFESSRRRVMEIVFEAFMKFSGNERISQNYIAEKEKFIRKVLGNFSSPLVLGRLRQGEPTPVKFSGRDYYLYWRKFSAADKVFAGVFLFFPAAIFSDREAGLKKVCEEIYRNSGRKLAAAFVPAKEFSQEKAIILPDSFDQFPRERQRIISKLKALESFPSKLKAEIKTTRDFVFLRSFYSLNHPYDVVIFAPAAQHFFPKRFPFSVTVLALVFIWAALLYYYYRRFGRFYLPLAASFRLAFFLSGILPVFLMLIIGQNLLQKQMDAEISGLLLQASEQLASIDQRSDTLPGLFGMQLMKIISQPEMQKRLQSLDIEELEPIFTEIRSEVQAKKLDLNTLFAFSPGRAGSFYLSDQRDYLDAKMISNILAISIYETSKDFESISGCQPTMMDAVQKTWYQTMRGLGNNFIQTIYTSTIEKENSITIGKDGNNYFFSTLVLNGSSIDKFLTFSVSSEGLFRIFLRQELDSINVNSNFTFLAAEIRENSDFTLFPFKKMNVLNSSQGKIAFRFLKKSRGAIFPQVVTGDEFLYLFYPVSKIKKYATGCIVSLIPAKLNYELKMLFLIAFVLILLVLMYSLASFATGYFLQPIKEINLALSEINRGNLQKCRESGRKDELGLLITTLNNMLKGFKKRLKLGKFVSGTLDSTIKNFADAVMFKKPEAMTGTVLFSDIRDFTAVSEKVAPEIVAEMLNSHLDAMSKEIQLYGGRVEQFIGDAIIAVFVSQPEDKLASIDSALNAAVAMRLRHQEMQKQRHQNNLFTYEIGIGIDYGNLTTGMISTGTRSEFIILGEPRLKAEQLEAESKTGRFSRIVASVFVKENNKQNLTFAELNGSENFEIKI